MKGGSTQLVQAWHLATDAGVHVFDRRGRRLASSPGFSADAAKAISNAVPHVRPLVEGMPIPTDGDVALVSAVGATRHAGYLARLGDSLELGSRAVATLLSLLALSSNAAGSSTSPSVARAIQLSRLLSTDNDARAAAQLQALGHPGPDGSGSCDSGAVEAHAEEILADVTMAAGRPGAATRISSGTYRERSAKALTALELSSPVGIGAPAAPGLALYAPGTVRTRRNGRTGAIVEYVDRTLPRLSVGSRGSGLSSFADAVLARSTAPRTYRPSSDPSRLVGRGRSVEGCSSA